MQDKSFPSQQAIGRNRKIPAVRIGLVALSLAVAPAVVRAATNVTWTGASSASFDNGANWVGGTPPTSDLTSSIATFSGAVTTNQPGLSSTRSVNGLLFSTASGGWTLSPDASGTRVLTVGGGGISTVGQTSGVDTINAYIGIGATQTWQAGTGGTLEVNGVVSGSNGSVLALGVAGTGNGTIILGNTNTFRLSGNGDLAINIAAGTVQLAAAGALGSSLNGMTGSAGAVLDLNGNNATINKFGGSFGIANNGSGTAVFTIGSNNGGAAFSGSILDNSNSGTGVVALVKMGAAQEIFSTANSYSGGTTIQGGGTANQFRVSNVLGLGTGTITLAGGNFEPTVAGTFANAINAAASTVSFIQEDAADTLTGAFTGSGTIVYFGNASATLSGDLTGFAGTIDLESTKAQSISLTNATGAANGAFVVANGSPDVGYTGGVPTGTQTSTLQWNGTGSVILPMGSLTGGAFGILRNNTASSTATFQIGSLNNSTAYAGTILNGSGTALVALTKVGSGTLSLSGVNPYTGVTTLDAGAVNAAWLNLATPRLTVANASTAATVTDATGLLVGEPISAAGIATGTTIAAINGLNVTLSVASTHAESNITTQFGGSLGATATAAGLVFGGGTLQYTGNVAQGAARLFTIGDANGNAAILDASGSAPAATMTFSGTGAIAFANTATHQLTLTGSNTGANVFAPIIGDQSAGNATSLTKSGVGTWTLTGVNTYTGTTSITGGTLAISGSGTAGTGNLTVGNSATLDVSATTSGTLSLVTNQALIGTGTVIGNIAVGSGQIAPGSTLGTLTNTGSTTFSTGSTFAETIDSTAGTSSILAVSGSLTLSGTLSIADLNPGLYAGTYTLATYGGSLLGTFTTVTGLPSNYQVDYSQPGSVLLDAVPEPASVGIVMSLLTLQSLRRRRRRA